MTSSIYAASEGDIGDNFIEALKTGKTELEFRARHEECKQKDLTAAHASTLRSEISFTTDNFYDLQAVFGVIDVSSLGKKYNPYISNLTRQEYSRVYDPEGTGLTQAYLAINGIAQTKLIVGRQYITLDNERFIGKDDFRQFPQNFDSITFNTNFIPNIDIFYGFALYVNTNNANARALDALPQNGITPTNSDPYFTSGRRKLNTHLININWSAYKYGIIGAYSYFNKDKTLAANSQITSGIRFFSADEKNFKNANYLVELARQDSKFNNPKSYHSYYWHFIVGRTFEYISGALGWEHLGKSFTTPLGSLHEFNGLADIFHEQTASKGLNDFYVSINAGTPTVSFELGAHLFQYPSITNRAIGFEYNAGSEINFTPNITLSANYVYFKSKTTDFSSTAKFWIMLKTKLL
jgi:opacity protein-like surface antigen